MTTYYTIARNLDDSYALYVRQPGHSRRLVWQGELPDVLLLAVAFGRLGCVQVGEREAVDEEHDEPVYELGEAGA